MSDRPHHPDPCDDTTTACGAVVGERNRWFTGKFVTARAYRLEQRHFLTHRWLHNRSLHGWGVAHGLRVVPHPDPDCAQRWVVVRCGLALDCCGRELVLTKDTAFELPFVPTGDEDGDEDEDGGGGPKLGWRETGDVDPEQEPDGDADNGDRRYDGDDGGEPADPGPDARVLCLRYKEEELEPVPAMASDGGCDPRRSEANLVRQTVELDIVRLKELEADCWRRPGGGEAKCRDDCDDGVPHPDHRCLEPHCPCGTCVPLALITPSDPQAGWSAGYDVDLDGRPSLPAPAHELTHVSGINWPHGGELTLSELREMDGRLEISFDRRLRPADGEATGINAQTFLVQYGGAQQALEMLSSNDEEGPTVEEDCRAIFQIDPSYLRGNRTIAGSVVYVTLRCDFVLDCHGRPVDGEHLAARLPSGDGVPGGNFESWFRVVADGTAKEAKS